MNDGNPALRMPAADNLVRNLARFGRVLRRRGADVGPNRIQPALEALAAVDITSREDCYWALRCTLVSRREDIELFDAAFAAFWQGSRHTPEDELRPKLEVGEEEVGLSPPGLGEVREATREASESAEDTAGQDLQDDHGMLWSATERLHEMDFAAYNAEELRQARRLAGSLASAAPMRRSRRLRAALDGRNLDKRRTLRSAMRTEGYPLVRQWRQRRVVRRKLVFLVDISGSMEPYARAMIMYLQAAVCARKVEAFTFGTRLTRVTRHLASREPDQALEAATRAVPDWAGGTRIGENLKALNDNWSKRGLTRGAVVVIISDGWERGNLELLSAEMERLHRAAHTLVWVNPLAGHPGYEPVGQGIAAVLPHVDRFLPGHNLRSLDGLTEVLESLPRERHRRSGTVAHEHRLLRAG
jgi:uncharacterized protein